MSSPAAERPAPRELEEAVKREARRFEPVTLYRLARRLWPDRPIRLRSKRSHAPEPTAVDSIDVSADRITITLNVGMLSSTSPLPSYFRDLLADPRVGPSLGELMERIDDGLLRARLRAADPSADDRLTGGGAALAKDLCAVARLGSPSGLWWLFSRVFPELAVSVHRGLLGAALVADDARVGFARLGSATLGGTFDAPAAGFDVVLKITAQDTWTEGDWPREVVGRLARSVWPALASTEVEMRVWLVDPRGGASMQLGAGRVGVEPLVVAARPAVKLVFEGTAPPAADPARSARGAAP